MDDAVKREPLPLEAAFSQLDDLIERLGAEGTGLEESFAMYKEGMELLQYCNQSIEQVEHAVQKLGEDGETSDL